MAHWRRVTGVPVGKKQVKVVIIDELIASEIAVAPVAALGPTTHQEVEVVIIDVAVKVGVAYEEFGEYCDPGFAVAARVSSKSHNCQAVVGDAIGLL